MPSCITDKDELIALVQRILDMRYTEAELAGLMDTLKRSTGCPEISDLIYYPKRPLSAAEIVDAALAHRPVIQGDGA